MAMRMKPPVRAKKAAHKKGTPRFTRALGTPAMIALVFCVMGAAILLAVSRPSPDVVASAAPSHDTAAAYGHENNKPAAPAASAATPHAEYVASRNVSEPEAAASATSPRKAAPVTITGCLEQDDETFRLKNAIGQDAPKARSWKSGFLKKGPAPIDVIDASHRLKLPTHVGQRVSVTGVLVGREMQVGSL
jgi:hypothetical protein